MPMFQVVGAGWHLLESLARRLGMMVTDCWSRVAGLLRLVYRL